MQSTMWFQRTFCRTTTSSVETEHSALAFPSPPRRTSAPVHDFSPDAVRHLCTKLGEAMPQLRFSPPALQKAVAVQLAISEALVGHPLRTRSPMPRCAPDLFGDSSYDLATRSWPFLGAAVIWRDLGPQTSTFSSIPYIGPLLSNVCVGEPRSPLGVPL